MKIGIDISALGEPNYTGVGVYVENLVKNLAKIDNENEYTLCYRLSRLKYGWPKIAVSQENFRLKIIQEPFNFLFGRELDIFHGPAERLPSYSHPKKIVTIHDMAVVKGEGFWTDDFREMTINRYKELLSGAVDSVITVSKNSKNDIVEHFQIDPLLIDVVYEGVDSSFVPSHGEIVEKTKKRHGINGNYILNVGALQERKNVVRIAQAFKRYREKGGDCSLVFCGKQAYGYERIKSEIDSLGLERLIIEVGHVPHEELVALYSGAMMFCFPSLFEGFGLPLLEAFACGCPVISSNVTSLPEVAGDAAYMVDPYSVEDITNGMLFFSEEGNRNYYRGKGIERAKEFSWEKTAKGVLEVYKKLSA